MYHGIDEPLVRDFPESRMVGVACRMSYAKNKTADLWRSFMPRLKEIGPRDSNDLYSLQVYPPGFDFSPHTEFVKWALAPVAGLGVPPEGMELFTIPGGLYAVFHYRGRAGDPAIYQYIFSKWLPRSCYSLDNRPHFEILGEKFDPFSIHSEEEIWIPVSPA